jgi:hypothetical protein
MFLLVIGGRDQYGPVKEMELMTFEKLGMILKIGYDFENWIQWREGRVKKCFLGLRQTALMSAEGKNLGERKK